MNEKPVEKIIGWVYCMIDDENMAAVDIYEGNYIKLMKGGALTHTAARKQDYDRAAALYEECVKKDEMISTAYEQNQRLGLGIRVPEITADPKAAEREWEIRKSPQIVHYEEPKRNIFCIRRKKEDKKALRCLLCGGINPDGQKFCGFCGAALEGKEEGAQNEGKEESYERTRIRSQEEPKLKGYPSEIPVQESDPVRAVKASPAPRTIPVGDDRMESEPPVWKTEGRGNRKGRSKIMFSLFLAAFAAIVLLLGVLLSFLKTKEVLYDSNTLPGSPPTVSEGHVAVKLLKDLPANTVITEEDIEGIILSAEQFNKYSQTGTYIDEKGQAKKETLLMWEDRDTIIGQYASRELPEGSLLYDTSVTPLHVVSDKTYVEVDVDGEGKSYQTDGDASPGNTRIQIVALVQTGFEEPKQVLLSELTLKDRSLESIFNSAGQDILNMLSGEEEKEPAPKEEESIKEEEDSDEGENEEQNEDELEEAE